MRKVWSCQNFVTMAASKASRFDNFSETERLFLVELVKEYRMIEEKGYDSRTLEKKKTAWLEVLDKFNVEIPSTQWTRCVKQRLKT